MFRPSKHYFSYYWYLFFHTWWNDDLYFTVLKLSVFVCLYVESFTLKWATWQVIIVLFVSFNPQDSSKVDFYFLIIIYYTYFFLFPPSIMYSLSWDILPAGIRVFFPGVVLLTQIKGSNHRRFHQLVKAPEAPWLDEFGSMRWMDLRQHTRTGFGLL